MPFPPRPVDATLHGVVDYTAGIALMTFLPRLLGVRGTRTARQMRAAGAAHAGYSTLTDYPLGIVKALPYKAHLALDLSGRSRSRRCPSSPASGARAAGSGFRTSRSPPSSSARSR